MQAGYLMNQWKVQIHDCDELVIQSIYLLYMGKGPHPGSNQMHQRLSDGKGS
jgi:hypothetical protein